MLVSQLFSFPVKSLQGNPLQEMHLDDFGPGSDRRFMLVDASGKFMTQRAHPLMAKIRAVFECGILELSCEGCLSLALPVALFTQPSLVQVWSDQVSALGLVDGAVDAAISDFLGSKARIVYMPEASVRLVDSEFSNSARKMSFADGFPVLLCNEASLSDLNGRLDEVVEMSRFRPNIVISGAEPYAESNFSRIRIGEVVFDAVKPCSRCSMITLDSQGRYSKEPLKTLASYRTNSFGACFGENLIHAGPGVISVGMSVEVLE
jgi:uncharacterized protein YcbX